MISGVWLFSLQPKGEIGYYKVFEDSILFLTAIPAAYLGYCFQRRAAFNHVLRELWSNLIESVNQARQFTSLTSPSQEEYIHVLKLLSKSIDEVRGVYKNIGETKNKMGLYPYESLKKIHKIISQMDYTQYNEIVAKKSRCAIDFHWHMLRQSFLFEFDRPFPTTTNSPYLEQHKNNIWNIPNCVEVVSENGDLNFKHRDKKEKVTPQKSKPG